MGEWELLYWIQEHCRSPIGDSLMVFISAIGNGGGIWIVLAAWLIWKRETRSAGLAVLAGLLLAALAANLTLKPLVGRLRPSDIDTAVSLLVARPTDASFPSGHTAASFAAAAVLYKSGSSWWKPAMALAVVMGFSRLYLFVHFPSDVLGGAGIGLAAGYTAVWLLRRLTHKKENQQ